LALFTHIHLFWIAALLLALIDLPDFGTPLGRIAGSVEKIADAATEGTEATPTVAEAAQAATAPGKTEPSVSKATSVRKKEVRSHV